MTSAEGGGAGAAGGGWINRSPNNLHWKKELTQIRKAARVLRDPGTSSSWWLSPPPPPAEAAADSARPLTKYRIKNGDVGGNAGSSLEHNLQVGSKNISSSNGNRNVKDRERSRVYLYNWMNQKSESERSRQIVVDDDDDVEYMKDEGSSSTQEEGFEVDSSNTDGIDSKSDGYLSDRFTAAFFKCMNSSNSNYSSPSSVNRKEKLQMRMLLSRYTKNVVDGSSSFRSGREDLVSLIDQSVENGDYCNSEDLGRDSTISYLLARLKNKGWSCPSLKMMRCNTKEDDSVSYSTQALSTLSYSRYAIKNPSTVESWDGDNEVNDQLGCGIPCYWSKRSTPKSRNGSSYSPSLSDTFKSSFFRGSRSQRKHHRVYINSNHRRLSSEEAAQSLVPLLDNSGDGLELSSVRSRESEDGLSAKFADVDLEALSRLAGRRLSSSCRSQEGLELVAMNGEVHKEYFAGSIKSLSRKYRPMCFEDLIGQNRAVQSLMRAVSTRRIAPIYLFQGPRGVGKTSMARVFAAALNCLTTEESKPCGVCMECADFVSGKSRFFEEVDGSNTKVVDKLKNLLRNISVVHPLAFPHCKVVVIDQCNLLPSKAWLEFLRILAKPSPFVVFILITTDTDNVPRTILTRCQKHVLNKIGNGDIVTRLNKISIDENLEFELNALELIALHVDGSLRDAETMLDQLSLFGKPITKSLVNELVSFSVPFS